MATSTPFPPPVGIFIENASAFGTERTPDMATPKRIEMPPGIAGSAVMTKAATSDPLEAVQKWGGVPAQKAVPVSGWSPTRSPLLHRLAQHQVAARVSVPSEGGVGLHDRGQEIKEGVGPGRDLPVHVFRRDLSGVQEPGGPAL